MRNFRNLCYAASNQEAAAERVRIKRRLRSIRKEVAEQKEVIRSHERVGAFMAAAEAESDLKGLFEEFYYLVWELEDQ